MIQLKSRAKINLTLDVLGKRDDGYHDVEMVMQSIDLHDIVCLEKNKLGIELHCKAAGVPGDQNNIAYQAAKVFLEHFHIASGVSIKIKKNIPPAAGLAGGSSNAATVLRGLAMLFGIKCSFEEISMLGARLGADVPFCTMGGCSIATGRGTKLTPIDHGMRIPIMLAKPPFSISTAETYGALNLDNVNKKPDTQGMIDCLKDNDLMGVSQNLVNVLETVTISKLPEIDLYKIRLLESRALGTLMSGSGPSVYGIFENIDQINKDMFKSDGFTNTVSFVTYTNNTREY